MKFSIKRTLPILPVKSVKFSAIRYFRNKVVPAIFLLLPILNINTAQTVTRKMVNNISIDEQNYLFEHLSIGNNKTSTTVLDIYQDKSGFMWFATRAGLYRYDGSDWAAFNNTHGDSTSLSDNQVRNIFEDSRGRMWIGTIRGGLCQFLPDKQKFIQYPFFQKGPGRILKPTELSQGEVYSIIEDLKGGLWIGTFEGGLNHMIIPDEPGQPARFIHYIYNPDDPADKNPEIVYSLYRDSKGQAWMGTRYRGLAKLIEDPKTGNLIDIQYMEDLYSDSGYPKDIGVSVIFEDSFGDLWLGSYNTQGILCRIQNPHGIGSDPKLTVYKYSEKDLHTINKGAIYSIAEDSEGDIWIATVYNGISFFKRKTGRISRLYSDPEKYRGLTFSAVSSLFLDRQNNMWIGNTEGIDVLFQQTRKIKCYQHEKNNPNSIIKGKITWIYKDHDGRIWVCSKGNGFCFYDPVQDQFNYNIPECLKSDESIYKNMIPIQQDKNGFIWFSCNDSLFRYDNRTETVKFYNVTNKDPDKSSAIRTMFTDHQGMLWACGRRMWTYDYKTDTFTQSFSDVDGPQSLTNLWITDMAEDREGRLWVGTYEGLNLINKSRDSVTHFMSYKDKPGSLSGNLVSSVYIDSRNTVWVGTASNGLNRYDEKTKTFKHYDKSNGLASNQISFITEDSHYNLWISSENGLSRFNPITKKAVVFTDEDGLLDRSLEAIGLRDTDGRMFFCSSHGLSTFYPDDLQDNEPAPPVVLNDFLLDNQPVPIQENGLLPIDINYCNQITLDYKNNDFAFDFAALNFFKVNQHQFAYKLDGFENHWTYTTYRNRQAKYTNISPGEYTFRVKASNANGDWNNADKFLKVIILPPWWLTWWAKSLGIFFVISSILLIYYLRVSGLKKRQAVLEYQVAERTSDLKEANDKLVEMDKFKEGMTSMIVHDLKNPLNTILHAPGSVSDIKNAGSQMLNMVMNILDIRKFEEAKMVLDPLPNSLLNVSMSAVQQVVFLSRNKNITIENKISPDINVQIDSSLVERVFVNLLTNAIKFSPNNERILIESSLQNEYAEIGISDKGPGIPPDKLETIFDKFAQVEVKESGKVRSTGLGLAFCKLAVEAHGGNIGAKSKEGTGTTFIFSLPLVTSPSYSNFITGVAAEFPGFLPEEISLSGSDKAEIRPIIKELKQLEVYQLTKLNELLNNIDVDKSKELKHWKTEVEKAIYASNEKRFIQLLNKAE